MSKITNLASRLEALEATDASSAEILEVLRHVENAEQLWIVADGVAPYLPIMRMVYRRALELGASEERARAHLASAHAFSGDTETAMALVARAEENATDDVLLDVWAVLGPEPSSVRTRLLKGLERCPDSLRLRRRLLSEALASKDARCAREIIGDLLRGETDPDERQRLHRLGLEND